MRFNELQSIQIVVAGGAQCKYPHGSKFNVKAAVVRKARLSCHTYNAGGDIKLGRARNIKPSTASTTDGRAKPGSWGDFCPGPLEAVLAGPISSPSLLNGID